MITDKVIGKLASTGGFIAAVAFWVMFGFMFSEVIGRYFLNHPLFHSVDIAEVMLLLICYLSLAAVLRAKQHINVNLVITRLPLGLRHSLEIVGTSLGLCWSAVIIWVGYDILQEAISTRSVTTISGILFYPFSISIPIGGALFFCAFVLQLAQQVSQVRER